MYEEFVLAGIGTESPLKEARNQIFLGSDSFITEAMKHIEKNDELNNVPKTQKTANRPTLQDLFIGSPNIVKKARNNLILEAHEVHAYTQREIGESLNLYPGYISRIILKLRKV